MTATTSIHLIEKRPFHLDRTERLSGSDDWYDGNPLTTQLLNAYTLLIPNGERFIIRSCRYYLDQFGPQLGEELEGLFFQEGAHSREHTRVLEPMHAAGLSLNIFRKIIEWFSYQYSNR